MAVADDLNKLGKNQLALDQSFKYLQKKVTVLEKRVAALEGVSPEEVVEEKATVKAKSSKETSKPVENLGFKIFGGVGFALILLGIFYLYRFAVDEGWIGIMGRIVLGIIFSLGVLLAAELVRARGYAKFSQLLTGGGLALLYFTFFATYYFEQYREHLGMTLELNTVLLTAVLVVAVLLSLCHDSIILAGTSFLFGYLSAFLLSLDDGAGFSMLLYALLLSIGMAFVLWKKNWLLGAYPVIASYILYAVFFVSERVIRYRSDGMVPDVVVPGFIYLIAFWFLFCVLSLVLKDDELHIQNILIAVANAFVFFGFGLAIVWAYWHSWRGIFVILIAAAYLVMAGIAKQRELKNLFETLFVLAVTFLTITIPVQLSGAWITIAWALEGLFLFRSSVKLKNKGLAILGYILIGLATFRVLFWDLHALDYGWRTFSFFAVIAAYVAMIALQEKDNAMRGLLLIGGTIVLTVMLAVEILDPKGLFTSWSENARMVLCSVAWAIESVALIVAGFINRTKVFRVVGLILFGIVIVKILTIDLGSLNDISRTIVTILVGIIALVASFVYVKNKEKIKAFLAEE